MEPSGSTNNQVDSKTFLAGLQQAFSFHQEGHLKKARKNYEELLRQNPEHPDALNLYGLLAFEEGDYVQAIELMEKSIAQSPNNSQFNNNLGSVYATAAKPEKAIAYFQQAIILNPSFSLAHENLGNVMMDLNKPHEAIEPCQKFVSLEPDVEEGYLRLANALNASSDLEGAFACLRQALARNDNFAVAHNNLGILLFESGQVSQAIESYGRAIEKNSKYAAAYANLATALWEQKSLDQAEANARRAIELSSGLQAGHTALALIFMAHGRVKEASDCILEPIVQFRKMGIEQDILLDTFNDINRYKIEHDAEQLTYLRDRNQLGQLGKEIEGLMDDYQKLSALVPEDGKIVHLSDLNSLPSRPFFESYNRMINIYEAPMIEGGAINPALDVSSIESAYHANPPGFSLVDNFLTDAAIAELRRFCLESTVWYDISAVGDLGASLEEGFSCPLLLQIAEEIRERFPSIYGEHYFSTCWSYRYYAKKSGDGLHGDSGRVSVNVWLTPDEANLEPERGGLLFWNKKVPMLKVKDNPKEMTSQIMRDIIAEPDAEYFSVPYKCNRATLFNSNIIHKTDDINFKEGYLNRRLNITFVFGKPEY